MEAVNGENPFGVTWVISDRSDTVAAVADEVGIRILVPTEEMITYPFQVNDHGLGMMQALKRNCEAIRDRRSQARADELWYTGYDAALLEQAEYRRKSLSQWRQPLPADTDAGRIVSDLLFLFPESMRFFVSDIVVCKDGKVVWIKKGTTWDFNSTF